MPSVGFLVYSGTMPLLKIYASTLAGYIVARKGLFPPQAARGASQVWMHLTLPCLIFANVVPAFEPHNVKALGPLVAIAFGYHAIGFILGLIIRELCYVPRNFWQGLVVLCTMSNWASLPNAIVMSVTAQPPFNPATDTTLGISYASIFIVCYHITFWVFGAAHSISWDYKPGVPQKEAAEFRASWDQKPIGSWVARRLLRRSRRDQRDKAADEHPFELSQTGSLHGDIQLSRRSGRATAPHSPDNHAGTSEKEPSSTTELPTPLSGLSPAASPTKTSLASKVVRAIYAGVNAVTVTLFASLLIALVPDLKALFVTSSRPRHSHWHGPDGRPPLAFILDTAALLGGITVPLSLILLGASFARLRLPRPLSRSPWIAMLAAAVAKTVVLPVIGIVVVTVMTRNGYLKKQDLVERFVAMIMAGTPAAINQLLVTGLWSSDGEVDTLSAFLFVQYVVALGTTAVLIAVSLAVL